MSETDQFSLIIFDCDGVLVDSEPLSLNALRTTLAGKGIELSTAEVASAFQGISLSDTRAYIKRVYNLSLTDADIAQLHERLFRQFEGSLKPIAGVADFIKGLVTPYCVASSSGPSRIDVSLFHTDLRSLFTNNLFSSTMVRRGKPEPDLFLHAAARMGFPAGRNICVIEDSVMGIRAAKKAGMTAIGLTAGSHLIHETDSQPLIEAGADWVVDSYSSLAVLLKRLGKFPNS